MCLSKPQKVIKIEGKQGLVEFNGAKKIVKTAGQKADQKIKPGDYVLCQSGFIVQKISRDKAMEIMKEWVDF